MNELISNILVAVGVAVILTIIYYAILKLLDVFNIYICKSCRSRIKATDKMSICPRCHSKYHSVCYSYNSCNCKNKE